MNRIIIFVFAAWTIAATALAGNSVVLSLDTRQGTRTAAETETLIYSPLWGEAGSCSVTIDGVTVVSGATTEGEYVWTRPETNEPKVWAMTHRSGDSVEVAYFRSADDVYGVLSGSEVLFAGGWR